MSSGELKPWPQVPACYGWLALDGRGQWRLQDEVITHPGLIAFLNAHYGVDERGCWLVQNGPQQVFVALAGAPWIARLHPGQRLLAHDGRSLQPQGAFVFDRDSRLFFATDAGPAMLDDRDLAAFVDDLRTVAGAAVSEEALLALLAQDPAAQPLGWHGHAVIALPASAADAADYFGFVAEPAPVLPNPAALG